jgi:hypothetical protein
MAVSTPSLMTSGEFRRLLQRVDRSNVWGADDELGALHFVGPDQRLAALATVREGEVVGCAAAWHNQPPSASAPKPLRARIEGRHTWLAVNEHLSVELHGREAMTHLDALGHFFFDGTGFGGVPATVTGPDGTSRHSVAAAGGILARGILLDLPELFGTGPDTLATTDDVTAYFRRMSTDPRPGDVLFVRGGPPARTQPFTGGLDIGCAQWLHDRQISVVVTDFGLDSDADQVEEVLTPWHVVTLTRMGVRLVDMADLDQLAAAAARHDRREFLTVLAPLPLHGSTSSPINPLAVF